MQPITPQPGNDRDPRNFVGRAATTAQARERLTTGANLQLTDPRRMGKTFWMRTFAAREQGFRCYLIDYEGVGTAEEFLLRTADTLARERSLPERAGEALRTVFDHIDTVGVGGVLTIKAYHRSTSPHVLLQNVLTALDVQDGAVPVVLMDEVPMAVDNIAQRQGAAAADELLQTLRALRQGTARIRWIVGGSIGFHHVLRRSGTTSGQLNDLEALHLGPLPEPEARELAQRLLLGIGEQPTEDVVEMLVEVGGGVPFLLHKVARQMQQHPASASPQRIRDLFEDFIDSAEDSDWFNHDMKRVNVYYGAHADLANQVLDAALTRGNDWVPIDALPNGAVIIIDDLVNDHYLERRGRAVRWRYPALAYLWARRRYLWDRP